MASSRTGSTSQSAFTYKRKIGREKWRKMKKKAPKTAQQSFILFTIDNRCGDDGSYVHVYIWRWFSFVNVTISILKLCLRINNKCKKKIRTESKRLSLSLTKHTSDRTNGLLYSFVVVQAQFK